MDTLNQTYSALNDWAQIAPVWAVIAGALALLLAAWLANWIVKRVVVRALGQLTQSTDGSWDDELNRAQVFTRIASITPAVVVYFGIELFTVLPEKVVQVTQNVAVGYGVLFLILALGAMLNAANAIYERYPIARERPIKGFIQVAKLLLYIIGTILVLAAVADRSPLLFLSGFGALTAVLMLVFKDTILSLVASVQITTNDMLRVGDWVEMPQYGADGDIIDIALHTVKIQNWDKTVTTVPTHQFIATSFKNWRFMSESGGRRIKRALHIDMSSVRFLNDSEVSKFRDFALLEAYVDDKLKALHDANRDLDDDGNLNARRLTNLGTFRAYVRNYLQHSDAINQDMTLLVRQLESGPQGLPLQIYAFTRDTAWATYEDVQADIFDHLIAIIPQFGLRVFQQPSGRDVLALRSADPAVESTVAN